MPYGSTYRRLCERTPRHPYGGDSRFPVRLVQPVSRPGTAHISVAEL